MLAVFTVSFLLLGAIGMSPFTRLRASWLSRVQWRLWLCCFTATIILDKVDRRDGGSDERFIVVANFLLQKRLLDMAFAPIGRKVEFCLSVSNFTTLLTSYCSARRDANSLACLLGYN